VVDPQNPRVVISRIAQTLLRYTLNHVSNDQIASNDCMSILNFIEIASSPETALRYLKKMNDLGSSNQKENVLTLGNKRKNECSTSLQELSIDPILVELQVLLCIPKLKSAISLVQALDEQPCIASEDKAKGWFQLLDYLHQKDMLLNESRNAKFHALTVGSKTGLDSILQFFQGIVHQVIDEVDMAVVERGGVMTDEEESWIRYHQLKVRKTLLKFCIGRAAFSSPNGLRALEVASEVSGLKLEESNYSFFPENQNSVWLRINDILKAEIKVTEKPLYLIGTFPEVDGMLNNVIQPIHNEHEDTSKDNGQESLEHIPNGDDIVPPSPANVPFVAEPIYETDDEDGQSSKQVQSQKNETPVSGIEKNDDVVFEVSDENRICSLEGNKQYEEIILSDSEDIAVENDGDEQESVGDEPRHFGGVDEGNNMQPKEFVENGNTLTYEDNRSGESYDSESYEESISTDQTEDGDIDDYDSSNSDDRHEIYDRIDRLGEKYHSVDDSEQESCDENQYEENSSYSKENEEYSSEEESASLNSPSQGDAIEIDDSSDDNSAHTSDDSSIQRRNDGYVSSEGESVKHENSYIDKSETEVVEVASDDEVYECNDSIIQKEALVAGVKNDRMLHNKSNISEGNNRGEASTGIISAFMDQNQEKSVEQDITEYEDVASHSDAVVASSTRGKTVNDTQRESLEDYLTASSMRHESSVQNIDKLTDSAAKEQHEEAEEPYVSVEDKSADSCMRHEASIDQESDVDDYSTASEASSVENFDETSNDESMSKDTGEYTSAENEPTKDKVSAATNLNEDETEPHDSQEYEPNDTNMKREVNIDEESGADNYSTASEPEDGQFRSDNSVQKLHDSSAHLLESASISQYLVRGENAETENATGHEHDSKNLVIDELREKECMAKDMEPIEICDNQTPEVEDAAQMLKGVQETAAIDQEASEDHEAATYLPIEDGRIVDNEDASMSNVDEVETTTYQDAVEDEDTGTSESSHSSGVMNELPEKIPISTKLNETFAINKDVSVNGDDTSTESSKVDTAADEPTDNMQMSNDLEETASIHQDTANDVDAVETVPNKHNQKMDRPLEEIPTSKDLQEKTSIDEALDDKSSSSKSSKDVNIIDEQPKNLSISKELMETVVADEDVNADDEPIMNSKNDDVEIGMSSCSKDQESVPNSRNEGTHMDTPDEVSNMSYRELQKECKARGLLAKGSAEELVKRILDALDVPTGEEAPSPDKDAGDDRSSNSRVSCKDNDSSVDRTDITKGKVINPQDDYSTFSYKELQKACTSRGLSGRGKKDELRRRLHEINTTNISKDEESCRDEDLSTVSYRDLQLMCKERGISAKGKHDILLNRLKKAITTEDGSKRGEQHSDPLESQAIDTHENTYTDMVQNKGSCNVEPEAENDIGNTKVSPSGFTKWASEKLSSMVDMLSPSSRRTKVREEANETEDNYRLEADSVASPSIPKNIDFPVPGSAGTLSLLSPEDHSVISMSSVTGKGPVNHLAIKKKRVGRPPKPPVPTKKSKTEATVQAGVDTPRTRSRAKQNASVSSRTTRSNASRLTRSRKY
jgi:hypothetical protein